MKNRIISFILAAVLIFGIISPLCIFAGERSSEGDEAVPTPKIYAEDKTVTQGSTVDIRIKAQDFQSIGTLDFFIFYDSSVFDFYSKK